MLKQILATITLLLVSTLAMADTGVTRAVFTTGISDREPVDEIKQLDNTKTRIYFFTEISGLEGQTITHRWEQGGEIRAEVTFNVGSNRWRVWSSKNLVPSWTGIWKVSVLDEAGNTLAEENFNYVEASSTTEAPQAPDTPEVTQPPAAPGSLEVQ